MEASVLTEYYGCSIRADLGVIHWFSSGIARLKQKKTKQETQSTLLQARPRLTEHRSLNKHTEIRATFLSSLFPLHHIP